MISKRTLTGLLVAVALVAAVPAVDAAMVAKMNLGEMTDNADRIFRGTVLDVEQGTVSLGGGELPTVTYTLRIDETFKGDFGSGKSASVVEVRMLGTVKPAPPQGAVQRVSILPEMPRLTVGQDYLLFTTAPSAIGLSTTVGLGQGSFSIYTVEKQEMAANELDNAGLFAGPVSYADLAQAIHDELGQ